MKHYESGGVPPPPPYLRDTFCKCAECGATWIGPARALCTECMARAVPQSERKVLGEQGKATAPGRMMVQNREILTFVVRPDFCWKVNDEA